MTCKTCVRLRRPLHRSASAIALRKTQVVSHPDLISVTKNGRSWQCHHQAVGKFKPPPIALQHWRQPASNSTLIQLHRLLRTERRKHCLPLRGRQPPEIEFVVIPEELSPLRRRW